MTEDEILAMEAGINLNELVAEYVMGFTKDKDSFWLDAEGKYVQPPKGFSLFGVLSHYSTDVLAAWQVWLTVIKDTPESWAMYPSGDGKVTIEHYPDSYAGSREESSGDIEVDGLFPEAMCKAALISRS